jgi:hypothetical protein
MHYTTIRLSRQVFIIAALGIASMLWAGCGNDSPTAPNSDDAQISDTPPIPRPTTPGGGTPARSETFTTISNDALDRFAPRLIDLRAVDAALYGRNRSDCAFELLKEYTAIDASDLNGSYVGTVLACSAIPISGTFQVNLDLLGVPGRFVLLDGDGWRDSIVDTAVATSPGNFSASAQLTVELPPSPPEAPHLRRDRYWELRPIEGQIGDFLLLRGPVSGEVTTSYTAGVSRTDSQTFGASITAEVGLAIGALNASVSTTLSQEFSTSVTVNEESTESFSKSVRGQEGKIVQFMVWELVEVYSISDAEGNPYEPDGFVFSDDRMVRRGAALSLDATVFPDE